MSTITLKPGEAHRRISVLLNAVELTLTHDQASRLKMRSSITGRIIAKGETVEQLMQWVDKP